MQRKKNVFIAEGERSISSCVNNSVLPDYLFVSDKFKPKLKIINDYIINSINTYYISQANMMEFSKLRTPPGIVGSC